IGKMEDIENNILKIFNKTNAFFRNEISNPDFFQTGESVYINNSDSLSRLVLGNLKILESQNLSKTKDFSHDISQISSEISEFNFIFNRIVNLLQQRGYKDFGIEGKMRNAIHALEKVDHIDKTKVLMLRRHEKDYIIRNEEQYVNKLNTLAERFIKEVSGSSAYSEAKHDFIIQLIDEYKFLFNKIVSLDKQIGIKDNSGLKNKMDQLSLHLENDMNGLIVKMNHEKRVLMNRARMVYLIEIVIAIILSIFLSLFITRKVTKPLLQLTNYISNLPKNDFHHSQNTFNKKADAELLKIYNAFNKMMDHLSKRERQRDKALLDLQVQELRYREMSDLLPVSLFETTVNNCFTYINRRFQDTFGYKKEGMVFLKLDDIIHDEKFFDKLKKNKKIESVETVAIKEDGKRIPVLIYCSEIIENCTVTGIRGILVDISDRVKIIEDLKKAKQKAEESDKLKTAFLANMSHEIRTPMNAIIGFSDLLGRFSEDVESERIYIKQIQNSGKLLLKLIDDIIDISKIEAGKIDIRKEKFNLNDLLEEVFIHFSNLMESKEKNLKLILEKEFGDKVIVKSDPLRLKQILINLINNALKFTREGYIRFWYKLENGYIKFYVSDSGIGIPPEKQKLIFERFRQADETTTREYGGTGLGLSISNSLVNILGGNMNVESQEGKGSTFYFNIPAEEIEIKPLELFLQSPKKINEKNNWSQKTVLITEDDPASMKYLFTVLKPTGIKIITAGNGQIAIEKVKIHKEIDIVLMDINLPLMNGYDATREIKRINPEIFIIAQTAYAMQEERQKCLQAGCDDYIAKPVKVEGLYSVLEKYMSNKKENVNKVK
ncbi:MAG: ATP-binding protein, partial [bacterium]